MKKLAVIPMCLGVVFAAVAAHAIDLKQSKVTQVVNDVQIISAADQKQKSASINDIFSMPDILRTGASSRAELVAADQTVTRVGANTIFSFDPENRTIDLKQGSLLFHSPHGKGGGTIHTGSATASVLGTTLIIVTTKDGGLKVIALEGTVEVKFLNGLKQKLDPGQMTFVLPGANQLAPVIIFRLDELTQNSLLIKGFNQVLDSLPLIQNQVNKQDKQIKIGSLSDTGLNVGNNATPTQVEVLDVNTVTGGQKSPPPQPQNQPAPPPNLPPNPPPLVFNLANAESADATINQPFLTDVSIPTPPLHVSVNTPFTIDSNPYFTGQQFVGFVANNIFMNTLEPALNPLVVNLDNYNIPTVTTFDIVALGDFSIEGSTTFKGLLPSQKLALIAGGSFNLNSGITLRADVANFSLSSANDITLDQVNLVNQLKDITVNSAGNITLQDFAQVNAVGAITLNAGNNLTLADSTLTSESAVLTTLNGNIALDNTTIDASSHVIMIAPTAITMNDSIINSSFVTLSGTANGAIAMNDTSINASSEIIASSVGPIVITGTDDVDENAPNGKSAKVADIPVSALNTDAGSGTVQLTSGSDISITGTSITAHTLTLNSGDGILLDGSGHTFTATGPGSMATFNAVNTVQLQNANLSAYAIMNIAANTIVLINDIFSPTGIYNFASQTGTVAINAPNPGGLSINNSYIGSTPITSPSQVHLGNSGSVGINSFPR